MTEPASKDTLREQVWDELEESGEARFPFPPHGRIPNFAGAADAAERLQATEAWTAAETVKANPDAPQLPVRRGALRAGKTVFVAVPRLAAEQPFRRLDPAAIPDDEYDDATTVSGISEYGEPVGPEQLPHVDCVVSGSVLVTPDGARVGKGEGFSDLEFAFLADCGAVTAATTVATTVHDSQLRDRSVPLAAHDVPIDLVCTPTRTVTVSDPATDRPTGIDWDALPPERIEEMPVLARRQPD